MDERDFKLIVTLDKTKNISRAADCLYITQSALSKRVQIIEKELGVALFVRSRQGIRFTAQGEIALQSCREAIRIMSKLRDSLNNSLGELSGALNAGFSINYALYALPKLLEDFQRAHPKVHMNVISDHSRKLYYQLINGAIDIAVVRGDYEWNETKILLKSEPVCAVCCKERADTPLREQPFIGRKTDSVFSQEMARWLRENGLAHMVPTAEVDSITVCMEMVRRGFGWAILPEICLGGFDGYAQPLFFADGKPFERSSYLMYTENAYVLPQVKALVEAIQHHRDWSAAK